MAGHGHRRRNAANGQISTAPTCAAGGGEGWKERKEEDAGADGHCRGGRRPRAPTQGCPPHVGRTRGATQPPSAANASTASGRQPRTACG
eukprot:2782854-Alexandrium_andersonii.AAC.1